MTWTKLGDDFPDRDAIWSLSDGAFRLHVAALAFSNRMLLDGRIPANRLSALVPGFQAETIDELVDAGVWSRDGDRVSLIDSIGDQPNRETVEERREQTRLRVERWRARLRGHRNGATNGVGNGPPDPSRPPSKEGRDGSASETLPSNPTRSDFSFCRTCSAPEDNDEGGRFEVLRSDDGTSVRHERCAPGYRTLAERTTARNGSSDPVRLADVIAGITADRPHGAA